MRFTTGYDFDGNLDFTEDGQNNAIFLDFASISGPTPPTVLLAVMNGGADVLSVEVPAHESYETLVLPFSAFGGRGGGPPLGVFHGVSEAYFQLFINNTGSPVEGSVFQLDRIRIGRLVPEPDSGLICFLSAAVFMQGSFRQRRQTKGGFYAKQTICFSACRSHV